MTFEILTVDSSRWDDLFDRLPLEKQDVFYKRTFAKVWQESFFKASSVLCAALESASEIVLYPFVKRNIKDICGAERFKDFYDTTGLYGRGGLVSSSDSKNLIQEFYGFYKEFCRNENIICSFDRFHPVLENHQCVDERTNVMNIGDFVIVDLTPDFEDIRKSFKKSVRKDVNKGLRNGVEAYSVNSADGLSDFLDIYNHTMDRNDAAKFYFFSESFFKKVIEECTGNFLFFYAEKEKKIVSCELVLYHGVYGHSFLGGTRRDYLSSGANPVLKHNIIETLCSLGVKHFLLGGGTKQNDGIFKFKSAYAPEGIHPSYIGGTIWNDDQYNKLKHELLNDEERTISTRFQFYDKD